MYKIQRKNLLRSNGQIQDLRFNEPEIKIEIRGGGTREEIGVKETIAR